LSATPNEIAIQNSIRTDVAEDEHREYLSQIGRDLQHVDDPRMRQ